MTLPSTRPSLQLLSLAVPAVVASAFAIAITYFAFYLPPQVLPDEVVASAAKACDDSVGCKLVKPVLFTKDGPLNEPVVGFLVRLEGSPAERRSATHAIEGAVRTTGHRIVIRLEPSLETK